MMSLLKRFTGYVAIGFMSTLLQTVAFAQDVTSELKPVCEDAIIKIEVRGVVADVKVDSLEWVYSPSEALSALIRESVVSGKASAETCRLLIKAVKADVIAWVEQISIESVEACESRIKNKNAMIAACEKENFKARTDAELADLTFITRDFAPTTAELNAAKAAVKAEILASETKFRESNAKYIEAYRKEVAALKELQPSLNAICEKPALDFESAHEKARTILEKISEIEKRN